MPEPIILVVDGSWSVGKTTLCKDLLVKYPDSIYIEEPYSPNHLNTEERTTWYLNAHIQRLQQAERYRQQGKFVIVERGYFSTLAYSFEQFKNNYRELISPYINPHERHVLFCAAPYGQHDDVYGDAVNMQKSDNLNRYCQQLSCLTLAFHPDSLIFYEGYQTAKYFLVIQSLISI